MVQVLPNNQRRSFGEEVLSGLNAAQPGIQAFLDKREQESQLEQENQSLKRQGFDLSGIRTPELRKELVSKGLQGKNDQKKFAEEIKQAKPILRTIEKERGLEEGSLDAYGSDYKTAELATRPKKEKEPSLTEKPVPIETSKKIKKILADNPKASSDQLRSLMDEEGIPPIYSNPYTENRRRTEEQNTKNIESKKDALRKETLPLRTELAGKAQVAQKSIQNKEQLLDLIKKGDINDPTWAQLAENIPLNLGKRLLSNDTIEYKAGLVEDYGDLKNIFSGATRVKEIDILENKIADLYLTDEQKERTLNARMKALKADIIRAEAAAEIEDSENLGILQFQNEIEKIAKPKLDALFNQILDENKSIIQDAENRKKIPLDKNDPEDKKIMDQIWKEAKGDKVKALEIGRKKGYSFK